ncbi:MAG TPA: hypothetical protein VNM45_21110 [Bacillus sp. (in: firmicutes)]|nr:hypothetical protein [Bacillus sp. (in: firmicutes)]
MMWKKVAGAIAFEAVSYGLKKHKAKKKKSTSKPAAKKTTKRGK